MRKAEPDQYHLVCITDELRFQVYSSTELGDIVAYLSEHPPWCYVVISGCQVQDLADRYSRLASLDRNPKLGMDLFRLLQRGMTPGLFDIISEAGELRKVCADWKCPECGEVLSISYMDLSRIGIPTCPKCPVQVKLELTTEQKGDLED